MIGFALRATLILGLALAALPWLRRAPASARRLLLIVAISFSLVVPVVVALVPARSRVDLVPVPDAVRVFAEPVESGFAGIAPAAAPLAPAHVSWERMLLIIWA